MAGRGPAPGTSPARKDPGQRRRRNAEAQLDALPRSERDDKVPKLPRTYRESVWNPVENRRETKAVAFLASTREWYEAWATSPMATELTHVHWLRLQSIAKLQDRYDRGDMGVAGELRQALAGFGGSPYDLRRLGKTIEPPAREPEQQGGGQVVDAAAARRKRLQAVPDAAG